MLGLLLLNSGSVNNDLPKFLKNLSVVFKYFILFFFTQATCINAFDEDVVAARAGVTLDPDREPSPEEQDKLDAAQEELIKEAEQPFNDSDNRDYIEDVRKKHDQIIDNVNIDSVTYAG